MFALRPSLSMFLLYIHFWSIIQQHNFLVKINQTEPKYSTCLKIGLIARNFTKNEEAFINVSFSPKCRNVHLTTFFLDIFQSNNFRQDLNYILSQ